MHFQKCIFKHFLFLIGFWGNLWRRKLQWQSPMAVSNGSGGGGGGGGTTTSSSGSGLLQAPQNNITSFFKAKIPCNSTDSTASNSNANHRHGHSSTATDCNDGWAAHTPLIDCNGLVSSSKDGYGENRCMLQVWEEGGVCHRF